MAPARVTSILTPAAALLALTLAGSCRDTPPPVIIGVGRPATSEEIRAWDSDVDGRGRGLPAGSGSTQQGSVIYAAQCAACHGVKGEGGYGSQLIRPSDASTRVLRNINSHWPYAPPLFDYVRRTMPPAAPWSLSDDEVYALVAYLLAENGIVAPGSTLDARTLAAIRMPARERFFTE